MEDLIKALQILLKYGNSSRPTYCANEELDICDIDPEEISDEDKAELERLGFIIDIEGVYDEENDFTPDESRIYSIKYGSG